MESAPAKTVNGTTTKYHVMNGTLLGQTKGSDTIVFLYDEKRVISTGLTITGQSITISLMYRAM